MTEKTERKNVTVRRSEEEQAADQRAADEAKMTVHAWRRAVLNAANGMAKLSIQLQRLIRGKQ